MAHMAAQYAAPISSTTYRLAVIRVDFPDKTMSKTKLQSESFYTKLKDYYLENSYNLLTVTATVSSGGAGGQGAFRLSKNHSYYASGLSSKYGELSRDAVAIATTAGFNLSTYDHLMIYHAGDGAETQSVSSSYIWSAYVSQDALSGPTANGKTFPGATFVPETENSGVDPLGVICHEYGHQIGLPDLYNTDSGATQIGNWSLMDSGIYIGSPQGSNPAHLDAWCKLFLGFSSPETIDLSFGQSKALYQAETTRDGFIRLPISVSDVGGTNEYFLLEYRRKSGGTYDTALPGQGLLIWHVDDSIATNATRLANNNVNNVAGRRGVDLVEADSTDPSTNYGDGGDPWPGTSNVTLFAAPKSNAYNGKESGIEASDISAAGSSSISMTLRNPFNNPAIVGNTTAGNVVVTGGAKGYVNPKKGESALLGIRPLASGTIEIKIYSLSGDLVWESSTAGAAGAQTVVRWDGKTSAGEEAASNIFLVHIKGGGLDLKKKIAIVR